MARVTFNVKQWLCVIVVLCCVFSGAGYAFLPVVGGSGNNQEGAHIKRAASQAISDNAVTAISFDTETVDQNNFWAASPNPTRITFNRTGWFITTCWVNWATHASGLRYIDLYLNGATVIAYDRRAPISGSTMEFGVAATYYHTSGDYIELRTYQSTGGPLNITASCQTVYS